MKRSIIGMAIIAIVFCTAGACKSTSSNTQEVSEEKEVMTNGKEGKGVVGYAEDMTTGTVVYSDIEGDCPYTIKTNDGRMFDPINMEESFQKDGMKVTFTFGALRMPNRCTKANPISIIEITSN